MRLINFSYNLISICLGRTDQSLEFKLFCEEPATYHELHSVYEWQSLYPIQTNPLASEKCGVTVTR